MIFRSIALIVLLFALMLFPKNLSASNKSQILGEWEYIGFIYDGQTQPKPNPKFFLSFTFRLDDRVRLYWKRADEDFFCERVALFEYSQDRLWQEVVWLNPENHGSCGSDPDMQMGRKTENQILIEDDILKIFMELNGKPFIYLLRRLPFAEATFSKR